MIERYNIKTWDADLEKFTPQEGMDNPCLNVDLFGLRRALRELQECGYQCNREDASVLVERVRIPKR